MHLLGKIYAEIMHFFCDFNQYYAKFRHFLGKSYAKFRLYSLKADISTWSLHANFV